MSHTNYLSPLKTQIELLYPGSESLVRGWNYVNTTDTPGPDSINQFNESCMPDSSIAFYWPWAVYQNITGELVQAYFNSGWKFTGHLVFALHHTKLALVPLSTSYAKIQSPGGYAIIYQSETGTLGTIIPPTNNLGLPDNYNASWPQRKHTSLLFMPTPQSNKGTPSSPPRSYVPVKERSRSLYPRPALKLPRLSKHVYPLRRRVGGY